MCIVHHLFRTVHQDSEMSDDVCSFEIVSVFLGGGLYEIVTSARKEKVSFVFLGGFH